jgi:hypothetical protein
LWLVTGLLTLYHKLPFISPVGNICYSKIASGRPIFRLKMKENFVTDNVSPFCLLWRKSG